MMNWLRPRRPARIGSTGVRVRLRVEPALEDRSVPCGSDCVLPEPVLAPAVAAVVAEPADVEGDGQSASTAGLFAAAVPTPPAVTLTPATPPVVAAPFELPRDAFAPQPFVAVEPTTPVPSATEPVVGSDENT